MWLRVIFIAYSFTCDSLITSCGKTCNLQSKHNLQYLNLPFHAIPYFLWYCIAGKFGRELNLAVWQSVFATAKLTSTNISYSHIYIWRSFKSTSIFAMPIWGPTAKFNSCQYFRLYSIIIAMRCKYIYDSSLGNT